MDGVLFKIDFEKAYDKVNWAFMQQAMRMKGFDPKWCDWVQRYVEKGSVGIRVNDEIGHYFQTKKGLRQGDPLPPILFNFVANILGGQKKWRRITRPFSAVTLGLYLLGIWGSPFIIEG